MLYRIAGLAVGWCAWAALAGCAGLGAGAAAGQRPDCHSVTIKDEVSAGQRFVQVFGPGFLFELVPTGTGWKVSIRDDREGEDLARLTPPFHFAANPRYIEGPNFRRSENAAPRDTGEENVNTPGEVRRFIFSPEVGRSIDTPRDGRDPTAQELQRIKEFGQGELIVREYRFAPAAAGQEARLDWMYFEVTLTWPKSYVPGKPLEPVAAGR